MAELDPRRVVHDELEAVERAIDASQPGSQQAMHETARRRGLEDALQALQAENSVECTDGAEVLTRGETG